MYSAFRDTLEQSRDSPAWECWKNAVTWEERFGKPILLKNLLQTDPSRQYDVTVLGQVQLVSESVHIFDRGRLGQDVLGHKAFLQLTAPTHDWSLFDSWRKMRRNIGWIEDELPISLRSRKRHSLLKHDGAILGLFIPHHVGEVNVFKIKRGSLLWATFELRLYELFGEELLPAAVVKSISYAL